MAPKRPRPGLLAPRAHDLLSIDERLALLRASRVDPAVGLVAPAAKAAGTACRVLSRPYSGSASSGPRPSTTPAARNDVPVARCLRRGGVALAADQLGHYGLGHLVEDLRRDREAASGRGGPASLLGTWTRFHCLAFPAQAGDVPTPVLPVTVLSLTAVAAMFKAGEYRSYANTSVLQSRHM